MAKVEKARSSASNALSFYIHIPYCVKRCGYCDFNTYTPSELNSPDLSSITTPYIDAVITEIKLAAKTVGRKKVPTIFFGGGTPSLLPSEDVARVLAAIRADFDLAGDAEITLEANPDAVSREFLAGIAEAGVNRISLGMQSAVPHVLQALDRTHNPENVAKAVNLAREVGIENLSVDLIYGVPGETTDDWNQTFTEALELPINHISAYALIVEAGTKLAARLKRGEIKMPTDDETAEKYLLFDSAARSAGFEWYELSNWAKSGGACRHNIAYWDGSSWWGVGPGAHSYWNGRRWWNIKHPNTYQAALRKGETPESSNEVLTEQNVKDEFIMLQIRLRDGISLLSLTEAQRKTASAFRDSGHIDNLAWENGRLTLAPNGRLIADRIVRELLV